MHFVPELGSQTKHQTGAELSASRGIRDSGFGFRAELCLTSADDVAVAEWCVATDLQQYDI